MKETIEEKASRYLNALCVEIGDRSVGSIGNVRATDFFEKEISHYGWGIEKDELDVMDWECGTAGLSVNGNSFAVMASPYSNGCSVKAELVCISEIKELENTDLRGRAVLLHGNIAREQIMPKNFVFYNPENHKQIVSLLGNSGAEVIICATGRNSTLAGGVYPFPMIEDGDFDIPSVYMTDEEGERLLEYRGQTAIVKSTASRRRSKAYNITAFKRKHGAKRIVITAHIDAKKGTPGAIDNATGVVVLLLAAELLRDFNGMYQLEIAPFNGEDYYAVPGQMDFIRKNEGRFGDIALNINIDGAGYFEGASAFSFYGVPEDIQKSVMDIVGRYDNAEQGPEWPQGDHSIFVQYGVPAIAVSSMWLTSNMDNQSITHTTDDNPAIVDYIKTAQAAEIVTMIVKKLSEV